MTVEFDRVQHTYMQSHAFGNCLAGCIGRLCVHMSAERSVALAEWASESCGAEGIWIQGLKGHEMLEGHLTL